MKKVIAITIILCSPFNAMAQAAQPLTEDGSSAVQDEIIITGQRLRFQLRRDMMQAEQAAYDLFNRFNDDKRFHISCSKRQATGSRIEDESLLCQPNFELEALRGHGQDYLTSLRNFMDPSTQDKSPPPTNAPAAAVIASLQSEYRAKMKSVAEQHPEFLEALVRYSETQARYRAALGQDSQASAKE